MLIRHSRAGGNPICIDLSNYSLLHLVFVFKLVSGKGNALTANQAAKRRLISLIYACWITHDKGSSWSCASLVARIIPLLDASWIHRGFSNRCLFCCKCIAVSFFIPPIPLMLRYLRNDLSHRPNKASQFTCDRGTDLHLQFASVPQCLVTSA